MSADIASSLKNWSASEGSNSPAGATVISSNLDDNLRMVQAVVRSALASKGSDVASAATTDIGAVEGLYHDITGSTTVTGLGTVSAGISKLLQFDSAPVLKYNAASLILPGNADITAAAGDHLLAFSLGSGNWVVPWYSRDTGLPVIADIPDSLFRVVGSSDATKKLAFEVDGFTAANTRTVTFPNANLTLSAIAAKGDIQAGSAASVMTTVGVGTDSQILAADSAQGSGVAWQDKIGISALIATTSGSAIDVTGIPARVKRITINFNGVSTNGTALPGIQLRDAGGLETTGYSGAAAVVGNAGSTISSALSSSFAIQSGAASIAITGQAVLCLVDAATFTWSCSIVASNPVGSVFITAGIKALTAALDGFSLVTANTFDAGSISYLLE